MKFRIISVWSTIFLLAACACTSTNEPLVSSVNDDVVVESSAQDESLFVDGEPISEGSIGEYVDQSENPADEVWFDVNVGSRVFFDYDSYQLNDQARRTLEKQSEYFKKYEDKLIQIEGHCDERGTREYNFALGERRANAVKVYLISLGVDSGRITTVSYGKERPVRFEHNAQSWSENRRGVTVFR